jgi:hypothetical protein
MYYRSILDNILIHPVKDNAKQFEELFIQMFPNYEFKQQLIISYFNTYDQIIVKNGESTSSLSWQLLTSHELVAYAVQTLKKPLLFECPEETMDFESDEPFSLLLSYITNLKCLMKLQNGTNLEYLRVHLSNI